MDTLISELHSLIGVFAGGLIGFLGAYLQRIWSANSVTCASLARCQLHIREIMINRIPGNAAQATNSYIGKIFNELERDLNEYYVNMIGCSRRQQRIHNSIYGRLRRLVFDVREGDWIPEPTKEDQELLGTICDDIDKILRRKRS